MYMIRPVHGFVWKKLKSRTGVVCKKKSCVVRKYISLLKLYI